MGCGKTVGSQHPEAQVRGSQHPEAPHAVIAHERGGRPVASEGREISDLEVSMHNTRMEEGQRAREVHANFENLRKRRQVNEAANATS